MPQIEIEIVIRPMTKWELLRCKFWYWIGNTVRAQRIILSYLDRQFKK